MFLVKALVSGAGALYFRSVNEPRWSKTKGGTRLRFELPDTGEFESYVDRPQSPIYMSTAVVSWREEPDQAKRAFTAKQVAMVEREREEVRFIEWLADNAETPPNYTEILRWLGWGQKRTGEFLRDLAERGYVRREKVGRSSRFHVTKVGHKYSQELIEKYEEEE